MQARRSLPAAELRNIGDEKSLSEFYLLKRKPKRCRLALQALTPTAFSGIGSLLLMSRFHNAPDKPALSVTVLRAVCSADVRTDVRE
jgi:hypothetical protein